MPRFTVFILLMASTSNLDIETLFPDGLIDETISAISEILNEIAQQWESRHFNRIRRYQSQHQVDLFEPEQDWRNKPPAD